MNGHLCSLAVPDFMARKFESLNHRRNAGKTLKGLVRQGHRS